MAEDPGTGGQRGRMEQWLELASALQLRASLPMSIQPLHAATSFICGLLIHSATKSMLYPLLEGFVQETFHLGNSPPQQLPSASFSLLPLIVFLFFPNSELARLPLSSLDCNTGLRSLITLAWPCSFPIATVTNYYKCSGLKQSKSIILHFWRSKV